MVPPPKHLSYAPNHTWVGVDGDNATVGVTEDLHHVIPEIHSIDLPMVDDELEMGIECATIHMAAELHPLGSPLTGRVIEVNREILDHPEKIFLAPFGDGWLFRMEYDEPDEFEMLMSAEEYMTYLEESEE